MTQVELLPYLKGRLRNLFHTVLLLIAMLGLLSLLGWIIAGSSGFTIMLISGILFYLFAPRISPHFVMRLYRARPLSEFEAGDLYAIVGELSRRAGLSHIPVLYYIPTGVMNAFSVGTQKRAAIGITDGLLRHLNHRELVGVLAHEVAHIAHNDLHVMALADMISRTTHMLSLMGQFLLLFNFPLILLGEVTVPWLFIILLIFAPTVSALLQLALSRTREYDADLEAVNLTGDPEGLASALAKMEQLQVSFWERIFLPGRRIPEPSLLRTHPRTEERIRRIMELEKKDIPIQSLIDPASLPDFRHSSHSEHPRWRITGLWY